MTLSLSPPNLDPAIPFLTDALDPAIAQAQIQQQIPALADHRVTAARLVRHKVGRRCLIEYHLELSASRSGSATQPESLAILGKIRAKGLDRKSYTLQQALWQQGFDDQSPDGLSVPEPLGMIPPWQMWLQSKVPGVSATQVLPTAEGAWAAPRIAAIAHTLLQSGILPQRRHTLTDELAILAQRLTQVGQDFPQWARRLDRIYAQCAALSQSLPEGKACGIHRDFYSDQVLVSGDRLYLLDLDLYCEGSPALDIGNFIAHLTEQGLRTLGDPDAFLARETAITAAFCSLTSPDLAEAIAVYKTLTLVRHISLSTQIPGRQHTTEALLHLCEQRLQAGLVSR